MRARRAVGWPWITPMTGLPLVVASQVVAKKDFLAAVRFACAACGAD